MIFLSELSKVCKTFFSKFLTSLSMDTLAKKDLPVISAARDGIAILKRDKAKASEVFGKASATTWAIVILLIPFVVNTVISAITSAGYWSVMMRFYAIPMLAAAGGIFVVGLIAQYAFKVKADYMGNLRVLGYASIGMILTVVPVILGLLDVYVADLYNIASWLGYVGILIAAYSLLIDHYKLNSQNAVITIMGTGIGFAILQEIFGRILVGSFYAFM
jgi:hypothetical protein